MTDLFRRPRRIVVIAAGLSQPSSTRLLADRLAEAARAALQDRGATAEVEIVELREWAHDLTNNLLTGFPSPGLSGARLLEAGEAHGITPYGTETMHVLRAEKGYPIIGQDTDGTVSPHDLGMSWAVSKKKPDFVGRRSFARPQNQDPMRKHLVSLLPTDEATKLPEGSQIVRYCEDGRLPGAPVPMLGHVTSSYHSAELARPFALALLKGGRDRIGEVVHVPVGDRLVAARVGETVLVDPEGARRDG